MTLAILLLNLLPGLLAGIPGISDSIKQIIKDISGFASAVIASGAITQPNVNTILAAWAGVIAVLKSDPNLPPGSLAIADQMGKAVQAALLNDAQAAALVDWSQVGPITVVP